MSTVTRSTLAQPSSTESPRKIVGRAGPWQLVKLVSETSLTRLYTARPVEADDSQQVCYAVKMLRKEWWRDSSAIEIFRREAWVGSKVSHPHVVPILSANVRQPPFFLTMPLLEGQTLRELLDGDWRPSTPEAMWIARQVVEGLEAIEKSVGMVHGDIKPENILLASTGHATLLDLGFARSPKQARSFAAEPVLGTLAYIAPENVTSAYAASSQSDQYSLGVVLYEMLTGRLPFESSDPAELVAMHRGQKPACIRSLCPDLSEPVASLVHRLLSKDPLRRGGTLSELSASLVRLEIESFGVRQGA